MRPADFFAAKWRRFALFVLMLLAVTIIVMIVTEYNAADGFTAFPKAIAWGLRNFYPTRQSLTRLPNILHKLNETILMSIASTTVGAVVALVFGILGSTVTEINVVVARLSRALASLFRNIDVAAWAMILLLTFGQNVLTGCLALFFASFGFLTRAFIETIDEVGSSSVEALRATGAGYLAIIFQAVIPASLPQLLSWVLFTVENNIRSATLVGILTGTGIGFAFNLYYKSFNYHAAALLVVVIVIAVMLLESLSNYIRKVIL